MRTDKRIFALGFFDGVHLGHQALLRECCALAAALEVQPGAITFLAHPKSILLEKPPLLISTDRDRELLLRQYGMEAICKFPVTREVMSTPWEQFLDELMECGAVGFVCGDDFHFGFRGEGNSGKLREYCAARGLPCAIVPEQSLEGIRISSTHIRRLIESGDMATAVRFLGHPYVLTGQVVRGQQIGRTLGVPTANLLLPEGVVVPKFGVYACGCLVDGVWYPAVTNIGTRPTVSGSGITVEPWILDFSGDLYGRDITLAFHRFLRPEQKFPDLEALRAQIHRDADQTRDLFPGEE